MKHYQNPLSSRYASKEMCELFSAHFKYTTWRKLWVALAEAQQHLGLPITNAQISELKAHIADIDFDKVAHLEKQTHHDVMAHILAYGEQCPGAKGIIHLGSTSCFVTDNTDLIQIREGFKLLLPKLDTVIKQLSKFALQYRHLACLGYTHFQPAQLTTVGKRACMWIQDFLIDWEEWNNRVKNIPFLGTKGTTGTQASFLALFDQNHEKVKQLDHAIAQKMGFDKTLLISGQTYTRKFDILILSALAGFASSAHKFATDLRLLSHLKEIAEPFEEKQVGSTAMPYKQNPILSERICALSRFVIALNENPLYTTATQWLERSLDDSANRRLCLPEAFLATDAILSLLITITSHLIVYPKMIENHVKEEIPFIATENILMAAVKMGKDRQAIHERIRLHSMKVVEQIKNGGENDLLKKIAKDPAFGLSDEDILKLIDATHFVGRAPQQVEEFVGGLDAILKSI
jgi:adenylosuccinate lyase